MFPSNQTSPVNRVKYNSEVPEIPEVITEESVKKFLKRCQDLVHINSENHEAKMAKMAQTIEMQNEVIESQGAEIQTASTYLKRFIKLHKDDGSLEDVVKKVIQAVMSIFFFLFRMILVVSKMMESCVTKVHTIVHRGYQVSGDG